MFTLNCKGRLLVVDKPLVMGIINITPDSFYADSRQQAKDDVLRMAEQMLREGASILDVGGQSTRPGSERVSSADEMKRVIEPVATIHRHFPEAFISIDTFYADVARDAVSAGACIVNDISAGSLDAAMINTVARLGTPYVIMHMQGNPQTMQAAATYRNVTAEVLDFFIKKREELLQAGIHDLVIDPGFGFGKTIAHNFELLRNLPVFQVLRLPLLMGISRKSSIYKTLGITAEESLNGTTAMHSFGLMQGANILRVHDVKEAVETVKLWQALMQ